MAGTVERRYIRAGKLKELLSEVPDSHLVYLNPGTEALVVFGGMVGDGTTGEEWFIDYKGALSLLFEEWE